MRRLVFFAALCALVFGPAQAQAPTAYAQVLDNEIFSLRADCKTYSVGDDFAQLLDVNDDGLQDLHVDFSKAQCDGGAGATCTPDGCKQSLYLQGADGTFTLAGRFIAQSVNFERPKGMWPSFVVMAAGEACNMPSGGSCIQRYEIRHGQIQLTQQS